MTSSTTRPAWSTGGRDTEGRGYGLILFAAVLLLVLAVNAVAVDETGSVLEPASTDAEMGDVNYADDAAGRGARAGLIRRPGGSDA